MTFVADAATEGVTITLSADAKVRLCGDRAAVARWSERVRANRAAVVRELTNASTDAEILELRRLIWSLLWDVGEADREAELANSLRDVPSALACYRQCWREYHELEELPDQRHWPGCLEGRSYNP